MLCTQALRGPFRFCAASNLAASNAVNYCYYIHSIMSMLMMMIIISIMSISIARIISIIIIISIIRVISSISIISIISILSILSIISSIGIVSIIRIFMEAFLETQALALKALHSLAASSPFLHQALRRYECESNPAEHRASVVGRGFRYQGLLS